MNYWLFKTEPDEFSIDDLKQRGANGEPWDGVRNYQARNYLRDQIAIGDLVFVYHSSCDNIGIAGIAEVIKTGFPDAAQFNANSPYYDAKATTENPRWYSVQLSFVQKFSPLITLKMLQQIPALSEFQLLKKGNRLSIMPVPTSCWQTITKLR